MSIPHEHISWLAQTAQKLLQGCQTKAHDGTILYTPDGKAHYAALWTRDFAYMVENAGDLMHPRHIEGCIRYLVRAQRKDGAVPDRVRPDGVPVYVAGPESNPLGEPNLDNPPFLVIAVDAYLQRVPASRRASLFEEWSQVLDIGMDWIPLSPSGLVYNNPDKPHSPYGFTDCIGKTGELLMESLLYWQACRMLERWHRQVGRGQRAAEYSRRARQVEQNIGRLWDEKAEAFLAATVDCRQVDIWGNAYALAIGFPLGERRAKVQRLLTKRHEDYLWKGQVRHLFKGEYWQRLLTPVAPDRYQNGAYWATATGWVLKAIHPVNPQLAEHIFAELIEDFRANGVYECVHPEYRQLESYVVSACNPLGAARSLWARRER
ncbi:MAG: hypothetical protein HPY54_01300 [Chthonomonadetes bacterium]|nr:hypothetical protein [Chthonomonadetes bacterium]